MTDNQREQRVIEQLTGYRAKQARIQVLGNYNIGGGIIISRLAGEDQLQQLHKRLRGLPSYMYLSKRDQALESTAHAYLTYYPAGVRAQRNAIPDIGADVEDDKLLRELRGKISKVIDARTGSKYDLDEVLDRLTELQDLQGEVQQIDNALTLLDEYKPDYSKLIRLSFIAEIPWPEVVKAMNLSKSTYYRLREKALKSYIRLAR